MDVANAWGWRGFGRTELLQLMEGATTTERNYHRHRSDSLEYMQI